MIRTRTVRGFTLIELLVVIAIIAILASIILASLNQARVKSRDARRIADLKQIQLALELYNNDNAGYPTSGASSLNLSSSNTLGLVPNYISAMPTDPISSRNYVYQSVASNSVSAAACTTAPCTSYIIQANLENASSAASPAQTETGVTPNITCGTSGSNNYYCVRP